MGACSFSHSIPAAAPRELFFSTPELPLCHRTVTAYILSGRTRPCSCRSAVSSLVTGFLSAGAPLPQRSLSIHRRRESASVQAASSDALSPSMAASSSPDAEQKPFAVLFVCLGNICRSPAAEGVFRSLVSKRGLDSRFKIDSAGTIGYHEGNLADPRMRTSSSRRGIEITSISRPIRPADFNDFDLILAMDKQNREDILSAYERWSFKEQLPKEAQKKVKLMCSYCKKHNESEVPDPYYGGPQGFEKVLDLLEDACESLLDTIVAEKFSHT